MATLLMGKAKKSGTAGGGDDKKISLKVSPGFGGLVHKVAAMRNKTVEELCDMRDVTDFFTHLLHILAGH